MPRAIWSGSLSFGLVNVPVKLYSATSPKSVRFHQLSSKTGARVSQKRVDSVTGEEIAYEDIVKGYEITPNRYVIVEPDELEALEPRKTKTIELEEFTDLAEIDPLFFDKGYFLQPDAAAGKAYRLLASSMEQSGRVGIGRLILRSKESLVAVRAQDGVLIAQVMLFGDEVLSAPEDDSSNVETVEPSEREVAMAGALIESMVVEFDPTKYRDEYREKVLNLIERKASGEVVEMPTAEPEAAAAPDLMAALEASLSAVRDDGKAKPAPKKPAARKRASKATA